jgi:hypothetical protein
MLPELPPAARKTIDVEGRIVKTACERPVAERQLALGELVNAIREFRKLTLTLRGSDYPMRCRCSISRLID